MLRIPKSQCPRYQRKRIGYFTDLISLRLIPAAVHRLDVPERVKPLHKNSEMIVIHC